MHPLQPIQISGSKSTIPSFLLYIDSVGQMATQGGFSPMVTPCNLKTSFHLWVFTNFSVFNPSSVNPKGYIIFTFTSCGAGMTTNTSSIINNKTIAHTFSNLNYFYHLNLGIKHKEKGN